MKNPVLKFCKSSKEDYIYRIFRSKNEIKDYSIEYMMNNTPDIICDERILVGETISFKDYQMQIIDNEEEFLTVSAPFEIVKDNSTFILNLKNDVLSIKSLKLEVNLGKNIISTIRFIYDDESETITSQEEISKIIKIRFIR